MTCSDKAYVDLLVDEQLIGQVHLPTHLLQGAVSLARAKHTWMFTSVSVWLQASSSVVQLTCAGIYAGSVQVLLMHADAAVHCLR